MVAISQKVPGVDKKMTGQLRSSMSSTRETHEEHEESVSSDYEKREHCAADLDEEKRIGLNGNHHSVSREEIEPSVRGRSQRKLSHDGRSLKTVRSTQSRAGGDGYTCFDADPNDTRRKNSKSGVVTEEPYLVTWDGDSDPANPRSMSNLRRWAIVLIVSSSSLCVYVALLQLAIE